MTKKERFDKAWENFPLPQARVQRKRPVASVRAARVLSGLLIVLGTVCILFTEEIHAILPCILGVNMAGLGMCDIYRGVRSGEIRDQNTKLTANGIVMAVLGFVFLFRYRSADTVVGSIWGMIGLLKGSEELNLALYHIAEGSSFAKELLHAGVELFLAVLLLLDPLTATKHHLFLLGIELVLYGFQMIGETRRREEAPN